MNEPVTITKFVQVCKLNCGHQRYCTHHEKREQDHHHVVPTTNMKKVGKGLVNWNCHNYRADHPAPEKTAVKSQEITERKE